MTVNRRTFIKYAQAAGAFYATVGLSGQAFAHSDNAGLKLIPDPQEMLDLPEGFTYTLISAAGDTMSDGFIRPARADGMACFAYPGDPSKCILMRNHENWPNAEDGGAFGDKDELLSKVPAGKIYDTKTKDGRPFFGGVTKVVYDLKSKKLVEDYLVLAGTAANCAGGRTPWGSWLTCEEAMLKPTENADKYHGFVFETPSAATGLIDPVPLKAMGRFTHEAASVDPETGIVYMTEDARHGLFYRYIPKVKGELHKGGRLQALMISGKKKAVTTNWPVDWGGEGAGTYLVGEDHKVEWIDLEDVQSPNGDLAHRGFAAGAAQFCRGEGLDYAICADGKTADFYFICTQGGVARAGQIWRYTPDEGVDAGGTLRMMYESKSPDELDMCDNLAVAPWSDIILCEDGPGNQYLRGLTKEGKIYDLARNAHKAKSEFCGACFSPDGKVMFVNLQEPGLTFAIEGPWETLSS